MPIAAPAPSSHQAAIPAYARVVVAKPPSAYASAKTAAATQITTLESRKSTLFPPFTLASTTTRYSNGVFGGLNRLLAAGLVAAAVLVAPSAAMACSGGISAVSVYHECLAGGGGGKQKGGGGGGKSSGGGSSSPTTGSHTGSGSSTAPPISKRTKKALKSTGNDRKAISHLVRNYGSSRLLQSHNSRAAAAPTAIGSAFDLGSGPTALLVILVGGAVLLLGVTGMRGYRQRHR